MKGEKEGERVHLDEDFWYVESMSISNIIKELLHNPSYVAPLLIKYVFKCIEYTNTHVLYIEL